MSPDMIVAVKLGAIHALEDQALRLRAALEAAEADARRYRWLRENDSALLLAEDVIDEAIDAELAREASLKATQGGA